MGYSSIVFSIIFFAAFAVYLFFSIYIIRLNPKSGINRTFFAVCLALCVWSFGFSLATSAAGLEECLFWRRFSAFGWATLHSIIIHFFLNLTGNKNVLKKWWSYFILYMPAVITLYIFSLSDKMAGLQYNLIQTPSGWINRAINNGWDLFFYAYYICCAVAGLLIIVIWKRKNKTDKNVIKQANYILAALLAAYAIESMTDITYNTFAALPIPQLGPAATLIPVAAFFYSIKHFGVLKLETHNGDEIILTDQTRSQLYFYLSITYISLAVLSILMLNMPSRTEITVKVALFLAVGIAVQLFRRIKAENLKYSLNVTIIIVSIIVITFWFTADTQLWVFPLVLIIIALMFSQRSFLAAVTATSILSQLIVLIYSHKMSIPYNVYKFIYRVGIYLVVTWLSYCVNKIFILKLKQISYQSRYQKMISDISFEFVNISLQNMDDKIDYLLQKIGQFFDADQTYFWFVSDRNISENKVYKWGNGEGSYIDCRSAEFILEKLLENQNNQSVLITDETLLPFAAEDVKNLIAQYGIKALMLLPVIVDEKLVGVSIVDSVRDSHKWTDEQCKMLDLITNLLATSYIKISVDKEIEFMAYFDHLTKLPNRALFMDRTGQAISLAKRTDKLIGVLFLDLDCFKAVNETLGHNSGDVLLCEVADRLSSRIRRSDTIARFGGDEFIIMINNITDGRDMMKIAGNIMSLFQKPFNINGKEINITASAGLSIYPVDGGDVDTLVKNADIAMYRAKAMGKNRYVSCTSTLKNEAHKNMKLSNDLYRALERGELIIYYQPQVCLSQNQIVGLEALLRWKHPELGMISPTVFIELAEKNGLIISIGEWVIKKTCEQNKKWQDMGLPGIRMAVNVSVHQFKNLDFVERIERILRETGLDASYLEIEITESAAIKGADYIADTLRRLKALGVYISIDDFGTEYSSLSRLKVLPVDRIKIDMQFIQGMENNDKDKEITKIIIYLAKSLGLKVLAEGVETSRQLEFLYRKKCDEVQGFYYYKPMPADEIEKILIDNINIANG